MINGKSRVLERLDDRSVGVGQLCVFSNKGYSHVFQKTIRSERRCSSNYLIALKKEEFRLEHAMLLPLPSKDNSCIDFYCVGTKG